MRKSNVLWGLMLLLVLSSCEKENLTEAESVASQQVRFFSVVEDEALTRAGGASWAAGDRIGIFMKKEGSALSSDAIVNGGDNTPFVTARNDGYFRPSNGILDYPADGSAVDFIAYYPYQSTINSFIYKVDVVNQARPEDIDLLYADNLTGRTVTSPTGNLQFYHKLSSLVMNISSSDGTDFSGLTASISGVKTKADFNLTNGELVADGSSAGTIVMRRVGNAAEAILLPVSTVSGIELSLTLNGKTQKISLPATITSLEGGKKYVFSVTVKDGGSQVGPDEAVYTKWRETPVITKAMMEQSNISYINHYMPNDPKVRNYSLLYDSELKLAYWVAYPYCPYYDGTAGRNEEWAYDPGISTSFQVDLSSSYGISGYDRGHQIPSGDRQRDKASNQTTFYYTNMTPQIGQGLNQSIWANLEGKVRSWSSGTDTLFIVTGAAVTTLTDKNIEWKTNKNDGKRVAVPKFYYKALARKIGGVFQTIGFKLEQKKYPDSGGYMKCALPVSDLEKETGFTFFPSISADIKATLNTSQWK